MKFKGLRLGYLNPIPDPPTIKTIDAVGYEGTEEVSIGHDQWYTNSIKLRNQT
jgi:hypothetical protein